MTHHLCVFVCEQVPSSEDAVTPSSAVTPSASGASSRPFIPVTDDPGAASIIAETMTKTKEVNEKLNMLVCLCLNAKPLVSISAISVTFSYISGFWEPEQSGWSRAAVPGWVHKPACAWWYASDGGPAQAGSVLSLWGERKGGAFGCAVWHGYSLSTGNLLCCLFYVYVGLGFMGSQVLTGVSGASMDRLQTCCWSCVSLSWRTLPLTHRLAVCPPSQWL